MKNKRIIICISAIILIFAVVLILHFCDQTNEQTKKALDFEPYSASQDYIKIPGFTDLRFKAEELEQAVDFYNPEENKCYFQISIYLSDETLIYQSDLITPSETLNKISLLMPLEHGIYRNCILRVDCFSLDDNTPLNGGEFSITINTF